MSLVNKILKEASLKGKIFFHGSDIFLPVGTILKPRTDYEAFWKSLDSYSILEKYRPSDKMAHKDSVFMVQSDLEIDGAGGGTEYVFKVKPLGPVEKHDMAWATKISELLDNIDETSIKQCAENYWLGVPFYNKSESLWEFLTPAAEIISVEEF